MALKEMQWQEFDWLIEAALEEDGARRDVTTEALIDPGRSCEAEVVVKQEGVICGLPLAERTCRLFDQHLHFRALCEDGAKVGEGTVVAALSGPAASILRIERTLLNFMQHLSGIATLARRFCDAVAGAGAEIFDTRKTTPAWRALEKYAVRCGGGRNHRMNLSDQVLIKDNHLRLWRSGASETPSIADAVEVARRAAGGLTVEVEVANLEELAEALPALPDIIMLDNMTPRQVREAAEMVRRAGPARHSPLVEVSGGVNLGNVRAYAEAGADMISVGALTHSAPALDIALDIRNRS